MRKTRGKLLKKQLQEVMPGFTTNIWRKFKREYAQCKADLH